MDDDVRRARLEAWFRADADRVLAFLLHRTDRDTAQDVLQEVFVIAYRKADVIPEPATGWLFGTARRVLANAARGQRRREFLALRLSDSEAASAARAKSADGNGGGVGETVRETLAALSAADREVLTLSAWYELSADEAAQALGCSRSAYNVRLHRARRRFAEQLRRADADATARSRSAAPKVAEPGDASAGMSELASESSSAAPGMWPTEEGA